MASQYYLPHGHRIANREHFLRIVDHLCDQQGNRSCSIAMLQLRNEWEEREAKIKELSKVIDTLEDRVRGNAAVQMEVEALRIAVISMRNTILALQTELEQRKETP